MLDWQLVFTTGAYDNNTGVLTGYHTDQALKVYESEQGLTPSWADYIVCMKPVQLSTSP